MSYQPPKHILEVLQKIEYEEALPDGDPRYVDTEAARGSEKTFGRLARKFGWNPASNAFFAPGQRHVLFFGHIGSGKSTELNRYAKKLDRSSRYYVIEVNVLAKLDRNNLQYTESLLAMAEALLERLQADGYDPGDEALAPVRDWFAQAIETHEDRKELSAEVRTGIEASGGIPALVKLFANLTTAFKSGATYKTEWRVEIRNRFSDLARAFNGLIRATEAAVRAAGRAERVVFVLDGTDKMSGGDTKQFFVFDAEQLLTIESLVVYAAPLHMQYEGLLAGKLDADLVLPMVKLEERDRSPCGAGLAAMRELLLRRADRSLFAGDAEIERLVLTSGGHPRELLRLLKLCCEYTDELIDAATVDRAIAQLAAEYRRYLEPDDYKLLRQIDADDLHAGYEERMRQLLYRLALMEYNDGSWRRSHPVVRTLDSYRRQVVLPEPAGAPGAA
jgi:hypothetical protein